VSVSNAVEGQNKAGVRSTTQLETLGLFSRMPFSFFVSFSLPRRFHPHKKKSVTSPLKPCTPPPHLQQPLAKNPGGHQAASAQACSSSLDKQTTRVEARRPRLAPEPLHLLPLPHLT
jgi:hypothetical protein